MQIKPPLIKTGLVLFFFNWKIVIYISYFNEETFVVVLIWGVS